MPYNLASAFPALQTSDTIAVAAGMGTDFTDAFPQLSEVATLLSLDCGSVDPPFGGSFLALDSVGALSIQGGTAVALPEFDALQSAVSINITITELGSPPPLFQSLLSCGTINITNTSLPPTTPWIGAFPSLVNGTGPIVLGITNLTALTNSFTTLSSLANFIILSSPQLSSLTGSFSALSALSVLHVENTSLTNLNAFSGLTNMLSGFVEIINNDSLTSVSALLNIVGNTINSGSDGINITLNNSLPTTAQAQAFIDQMIATGFTGTFTNSGNGPG